MTRCRIYDTPCINPAYCDKYDACCAGDMNCKPPMTTEDIETIVSQIKIFDRKFHIEPIRLGMGAITGWYLQVIYFEPDIDTGQVELQKSRKWVIELDASETDVVHTAFAAVMRSYDHVVQEHFTYKGKRIYSPHFSVEDRLKIAP